MGSPGGGPTSIPPHNLGEVVDACTLLVDARIAQAKVAAGLGGGSSQQVSKRCFAPNDNVVPVPNDSVVTE